MRWYDNEPSSVYGLIRELFCAAAIMCALFALHRIANGLLLGSQLRAYGKLKDAYTPEEREILIHKIKNRALKY